MATVKGTKPGWPKAFLRAYAKCGNVTEASRIAGVTRQAVFHARKRSPRFDEAYKRARAEAVENLERIAHRLATKGSLEPIYQNGKRCGYKVQRYPQLLLALLRAHKPRKYGGKTFVEHTERQAPAIDRERQRAILADPELARLACQLDERLASHGLTITQTTTLSVGPAERVIDCTPGTSSVNSLAHEKAPAE